MSKTIKVLAIDGGGIRGVIPSVVLSYIEKELGKPISDTFDLICGTSTGGILALCLAMPGENGQPKYSTNDIISLYENLGKTIFSRSIFHKIRSLGSLAEEKYPRKGIDIACSEYFGSTMLSELRTDVLIPSYEIERQIAFFFKSRKAKSDSDYDFAVKDVAQATSAAPTYFEPMKIERGTNYFSFVDGGLVANNPSLCGFVEAKSHYGDFNDIVLLSLGTGISKQSISHNKAASWGVLNWVHPLINLIFDGSSDTVDYQLRQLLPIVDSKFRYLRLQTKLNGYSRDMDDAGSENIRNLRLLGEEICNTYQGEIDMFVRLLKES